MARGLDHIVHAVRDLDTAAALYRRLGFQVGARNRLPLEWGAQNHIVQLPRTFIELLAITDDTQIVPHGPRSFSFGAFNRDFLARGQGLTMLVLQGRGKPDADEFRAAGIGDFEVYEFERKAKRPDGTPAKVAFALAFAADPRAPAVGYFTCQQRHPEHFWNPAFQVHANTAAAVAGIVLAAKNPSDHQDFLAAFAGQRDWRASPAGIAAKTPHGEIEVLTPAAFTDRFGTPPPPIEGARLSAIRFAVRQLPQTETVLKSAAVSFTRQGGRLIVGPDAAMGATMVFETLLETGG